MSRQPRRALFAAVALVAGAVLGVAVPAGATHSTVSAVRGGALGYWADNISLFGGAQADTGPTPTVELATDASNSPQVASATTGRVAYGPAVLFTSDDIEVSTIGSLGSAGSAVSSSSIDNINKATTQADTGSEIFTADNLSGTATADAAGVSGSTTVTNGTVETHSNSANCSSLLTPCGGHTHDPVDPTGVVNVPANPPANFKIAGHVHLNDTTTDHYVIVFNEQITNPDGSITVNPVHEYFGARLDADGNIVRDPPYSEGGSILQGDLFLGQVVAGVTAEPGPNAPPVGGDDAYSTDYQTALTVPAPGVLANDSDPDGGPLSAGGATDPANGTVTLNADGSFAYTPDSGFSGTDSFEYTVADDHGATDTATVTITVGAPPPANADVTVDGSGPASAEILTTATYTFAVSNLGPDPATGVSILITTSGLRGASFGSASSSDGGACTSLKGRSKGVRCELADIADGATDTVTIEVKMPRKTGTLTVTGTASSTSPDGNTANNSDSVNTDVFRP